jgi:RNA polymerase sigma-70 factor (ECF subfamily)
MAPTAGKPEHDVGPDNHLVVASDADLLGRIAAREREAFEILFHRYARPVFGLALRRLRDRGRAEGATREAFAAIWRSAGSYVPERGAGARWLFTVACNAIVDHGRTASPTQLTTSAEPPGVASPEPGHESTAEDGWVAFHIHAALAELPELERVPLQLAYWNGRTQSEIAELLALPLGTVKTRTRSALASLAVRLEERA